uniref:Rab-GAP TBC domain-containing protein n=1 Tax=Strombidium inclinatum TaxID=197538 RepID=A0A7S3ITL6_9SPIT|mmetsp:Transcript_39641/g.60698  ORF Transcript_39641/g.60698 Transcript_39641/m.60698 type:complete len:150 (+) Transcript_39641:3227-3676(+)
MNKLEWRKVFNVDMQGLVDHLDFIADMLSTTFREVYDHLIEELDEVNLVPYFTGMIMTVFISDLQDISPQIATHIFDIFLFDGHLSIFQLLTKFISLQEEEIKQMYDEDLQFYIAKQMPLDCLKKYPMYQLLDFEASVEEANNPNKLKC